MKLSRTLLIALVTLAAVGCSHNKVATNKITDNKMTCSQIEKEVEQVKSIKKDIDSKRGLSGRNVGMALLFWPGVIVNEMNGSDAEKLANERIEKLNTLYVKKGC